MSNSEGVNPLRAVGCMIWGVIATLWAISAFFLTGIAVWALAEGRATNDSLLVDLILVTFAAASITLCPALLLLGADWITGRSYLPTWVRESSCLTVATIVFVTLLLVLIPLLLITW